MSTSPAFAINGRFLTQPVTGVQRYARNVVGAMDAALAAAGRRAALIAPAGSEALELAGIDQREAGPLSGHAWEQITLPSRWPGRLLSLCNGAPATKRDQVVCIHDANVLASPQSYSRAFRTVYGALLPKLAAHAARIATVSQFSARDLARRLGLRAEDIAVLPNGHEHALAWNPAKGAAAMRALGGLGGRRFVLALGSRARHKNMELLIKAAPELDALGLDVVIAGGDGGVFASEVLLDRPNVKLIGRVADDDLAYLMGHAVCLAFPSWTEGFGLPIVEAMARGCPVVSSDRASMPEICGGAALLAAPDDPAAWVRLIHGLAESPRQREELIGKGLERVLAFSWEDTAAGYLDLMEKPFAARRMRPAFEPPPPAMAVVVATLGRPAVVAATVGHLLETQTVKPAAVIVSCAAEADAGDLARRPDVTIVMGPPGLPAQRNRALDALGDGIDVVVFFDDDFVADAGWLAAAARTFRDCPDVAGFTGAVLADDVKGPGLSFEEAKDIVLAAPRGGRRPWIEPYSPYGCNMAFRRSAIGPLRFDERLPLYGWLEDRDFGAAVAGRGGRLVKSAEARGVHMGAKGGRVAGERFGYSQIVNPLYLRRKGTMSLLQVADHIFRNMASNVGHAPFPEAHIDRRGRLIGNLKGIADALAGRIEPERVLSLGPGKGR